MMYVKYLSDVHTQCLVLVPVILKSRKIRHFLLQIRQSTVTYPSQSVILPSIFRRKTPKSVSVPVTFRPTIRNPSPTVN